MILHFWIKSVRMHFHCSLRNRKRVTRSRRHSASPPFSFLISGASEVSVLSSLFSCCVCGNSYCYYFHVYPSVRCWFCILVSEPILHVGLKWLSCDDRQGRNATGVWLSRFPSGHFSEGNVFRRVATLSLALWSQQKLVNHPHHLIGPFAPNTCWVWSNERVQWDTTTRPADGIRFCHKAVWGLTLEMTAFCLCMPSASCAFCMI